MKVYQINVVCGSGSTGRIVTDLSRVIQKKGGECRIAYGRGNAPADVDAIKISNEIDLYWHAMMTRLTDRHGLYSKHATARLIKDIQQYKPDVIHLHNIHGYYVNYEMLFAFLKKYNKPVVWTLHDCWAFTGHCAHYDYIKCDKWKEKCFNCPQKTEYPGSILLDNSMANYAKKKEMFTLLSDMNIVTVSDWLKNVVEQSFLRKYPVFKISNGIDLKIMKATESTLREQYDLQDRRLVLGVASVWNKRKGINTFFKLAKYLPEQYKIVLIGLNKKQMKMKPDNILGIDKISNPVELAKWYTLADVYVNTSVEETMGLTTVEAMACGTPAVVMNATANPELVNDDCGRVVEPNDLQQLVDAIQSLDKDVQTMEACVVRAKAFEKSKQYEKYVELYRDVIAHCMEK